MELDLDGLDGALREPSVIVDMTQPPLAQEPEELPTVVKTMTLTTDAWAEVPTLAPEHVQLRTPWRSGVAIACAAVALVAAPLAVRRLARARPLAVATTRAAAPAAASASANANVNVNVQTNAAPAAPNVGTGGVRAMTVAALPQTIPFLLGSTVPEVDDDELLAAARSCPGTVVVTGHSCWLGTARVQRTVGFARAAAVRTRLVAAGFDPTRIRVTSAGSRQPVATNLTRAGQRANRRATLTCTTPGGEE